MPDEREYRRRYGDKEVGLILKRAAELQRQEPASAVEGGGLTLAELEEIAVEAGIDARHLQRAAAELDAGAARFHREGVERWLGGPVTIELQRSLPGELPESEFESLAAQIQEVADAHGQASLLGHTLTWRSATPEGERSLQVTVSTREGRTRIRIEERLHGIAGGLFGGIMGGVGGGVGLGVGLGVGIGALGSAAFATVFPLAVITGSYLLARSIFGSLAWRRQRVLRELLDRLTEYVEGATSGQALEPGGPARELPGA
jgi:hypothetical protein